MAGQHTRQDIRPDGTPRTAARSRAQPRTRQARQTRGYNGFTRNNPERLARLLGWFSIGLGLTEFTAPRGIAQLMGVRGDHRLFIRLSGVRKIAHGIGILSQRRPVEGVWSRVWGDVLDLTFLGTAFRSPRAQHGRLAVATATVLGVSFLDVLCAQQLSRRTGTGADNRGIRVQKSIIINRSPAEIYQFWRDFQHLPQFMYHLESVKPNGQGRSHWVAKAPAGTTVEWDAEITADDPNERIEWRSLAGADVENTGTVRFERAPGGRGTMVRVEITYRPPGGVFGSSLARLFGEEPEQQMQDDLHRLKQVLETGEVVRSEGSLQGMGAIAQRPAQPPAGERGQHNMHQRQE